MPSVHLRSDNFRCDDDDDYDDDDNNNNRLKDLLVSKIREPISELCDVLLGTLFLFNDAVSSQDITSLSSNHRSINQF
jgi:hypothetical protein